MPSLAPELIRLDPKTVAVDPPSVCRVCGAEVVTLASDITAWADDDGRNGITMLDAVVSFAVTAQPCGHLIRQWKKGDDA
jgi:hypothetical protein